MDASLTAIVANPATAPGGHAGTEPPMLHPATTPVGSGDPVELGYGGSLTSDVVAFEGSLERAADVADPSTAQMAKTVFQPLDYINTEAASLADFAQSAMESDDVLSPGEIVSLTVKSQEFMFHSQLTANIANRTSDGVQQLFRQQG